MKRVVIIFLMVLSSTLLLNAQEISVQNGLYVDANGQLYTGQFSEHFSSGAKKSDINIIKGKIDGYAVYFYESGARMEAGTYLDGLRNGVWEKWNEKGIKTGEA